MLTLVITAVKICFYLTAIAVTLAVRLLGALWDLAVIAILLLRRWAGNRRRCQRAA